MSRTTASRTDDGPRRVLSVAIVLIATFGSVLLAPAMAGAATEVDPAALEFFEKEVRPLLVAHCQSCHGPEEQKGGLRLDSLAAVLEGGDTGPAVEPGDADSSLLIEAVRYDSFYQMPPKSKLSEDQIETLTKWVTLGAPWPGDAQDAGPSPRTATFDLAERARHWSFQPIDRPGLPDVANSAWPTTPIDRFLLAELEANGLQPAPDADRRTWLRRVTFDMIGLPPTPEDVAAFLADQAPEPDARARVVDRLLASPRYGERWARHWLDLVCFAETAGHEFDYDIQNAWRYRDYVVRAWNADVPYDRFLVEHVAGDLLDDPRRDPLTGANESILGTGFFALHEGTHSPVDLVEDEATRVDNQIDVLTKTFLGLTVACARCHDHKFDPVTQRDYYALAGYLRSTRHQQAFLDPPDAIDATLAELQDVQARIQEKIAGEVASGTPTRDELEDGPGREVFAHFASGDFSDWATSGPAFRQGPTTRPTVRVVHEPGGVSPSGARVEVVPAGWAHSGLLSDRLAGVLRSRTFRIEHPYIQVVAAGRAGRINVVVDGYEKIRAPIYGGLSITVDSGPERVARTIDVRMWHGHRAYIEIADGGVVDFSGARSQVLPSDGHIAVEAILFSDHPDPPAIGGPEIRQVALDAMDAELVGLVQRHHELESMIPPPTLGLAVADGTGEDVPLHVRGSTRNLGDAVPRRFLEVMDRVLGSSPEAPVDGSGRLELAGRMASPANPLTARVIVNRVWAHHFGAGIVATPDDLGLMGRPPTHPELLDWLASEFIDDGWSLKGLHRRIVLSRAYGLSSVGEPESDRVDPENRLLHRMNVRRLEAEAIRDAMLALSGRLDPSMGGPGVPPHLTAFMEGRGRPERSGPLDGDGRRSLYIEVRRNFLTPMLLAFDLPTPFSTIGRRHVSNVPAQALTLLNDPFVLDQAERWAARVLADPALTTPAERVDAMYQAAFARSPTPSEQRAALAFVLDAREAPESWSALAHVLFNVKEFVFIP